MMSMHGYPTVALSGHPQLFLQQNLPLPGRPPIYKVAPAHGAQHSLLPPVSIMRTGWITIIKHDDITV
jgi:hypothetical protein